MKEIMRRVENAGSLVECNHAICHEAQGLGCVSTSTQGTGKIKVKSVVDRMNFQGGKERTSSDRIFKNALYSS